MKTETLTSRERVIRAINQVPSIMGGVPPESIVAMLDTAYEESLH